MPLSPGTRLGPYEVLAKLGEGGMGEVYRARDARLERDVALKILPPHLADDADRRARFEREAKAVAALSDPNILAIFDVGIDGGTAYAAMELLDGETLRSRLAAGVLSPRKAADLAVQIAHGLAAAHGKGLVHRDLKPENLFITREGRVKILDFGLAKTPGPGAASATAGATDMPTAPANTAPGVVMGTCGYMAPEQVRGQAVDHRTDIFAFGAVLYEMLSGARAFAGSSAVETMNAVLTADPPAISSARNPVPPAFDRILRRCLEKHPDERFQSARDLAFALQAVSGVADSGSAAVAEAGGTRRSTRARSYVPGAFAGAALASVVAAAAAAVWMAGVVAPTETKRVVRFSIDVPAGRTLESLGLSPDGSLLAYLATENRTSRLYVRPLEQSTDAALAGTEGAVSFCFSPNSRWIAFFANGRLRRLPSRGGDVTALADSETIADRHNGAHWASDGTIVFSYGGSGLLRIPESGGKPVSIAVPTLTGDDQFYLFPHVGPGAKSILFTVTTAGDFDSARIDEIPIGGGLRHTVIRSGTAARVLPTGRLLYADGGRLVAASAGGATAGDPVAVVDGLAYVGKRPLFDVSAAGDLALATQLDPVVPEPLRVDRRGRATKLDVALPGMAQSLAISPDGTQLTGWLATRDRSMALWVLDLARGVLTQVRGEGRNHVAVFSPDGRALTFSSDRNGPFNLYVQSADGSGAAERLTTGSLHEDPSGWTPDGRWLAFAASDPRLSTDILAFDRTTKTVQPFRRTAADERYPALSPDGRWLAYASDESGRPEVYAEAFPGGGSRVQLSTEGGTEPLWSPAGQELFYRSGRRVMSLRLGTGPVLSPSRPEILFEGPFDQGGTFGQAGYAVSRDGQTFYFLKGSDIVVRPARIEVILNWIEEFKQRVAK